MLNEVDVLILQVYTLKSDHDDTYVEAICDEMVKSYTRKEEASLMS